MINTHSFHPQRRASITQNGNTILVNDAAHQDCRCRGDFFYAVQVEDETITIRGSDNDRRDIGYTLNLSESGVQVDEAIGRGRPYMVVETEAPMDRSQQQQFGLNLASSLIGFPLSFKATDPL